MGEHVQEVILQAEFVVRVIDHHATAAYLLGAAIGSNGQLELPDPGPLERQAAQVVAEALESTLGLQLDYAGITVQVLVVKPIDLSPP